MVSFRVAFATAALLASSFALEATRADIRPLKALRRNLKNQIRDNALFQPSTQVRLDYVDEGTIHHDVPFGAMLNIETKQPAVVLEHFESVLNGVTCSPAGIYIAFNSEPQAGKVRNSWNGHEFIVITSHIGCNNDGERVPYLISNSSFEASSAMLYGHPISWRNASKSLDLEFGAANLELRSIVPGVARRADSTSKDINFSLIDQTLFSQDGVTQKCKNCTGTSKFAISSGAVKLVDDVGNLFKSFGKDGLELENFVEAGDIDITVTNMGARLEFETDILLSKSFAFHLAGGPVSLTGFSIAGVVSIGPAVDPMIVIDISMIDPLQFTYGFEFAVPDGSSINVDLINIASSKTTGFDKTNFKELPLQINDPRLGANFSVAFRPVLELGISLLEIDINPIVVFADIPKFEGTIQLVPNGDATCKAAANGSPHVSFNGDFVLDIGVGIDIKLTDQLKLNPSVTLAEATLLPFSTCFEFGGLAQATAPPGLPANELSVVASGTAASAKITAAPSASKSVAKPPPPIQTAAPAPAVSTVTVVPLPAGSPNAQQNNKASGAYGIPQKADTTNEKASNGGYGNNKQVQEAKATEKEVEPAASTQNNNSHIVIEEDKASAQSDNSHIVIEENEVATEDNEQEDEEGEEEDQVEESECSSILASASATAAAGFTTVKKVVKPTSN